MNWALSYLFLKYKNPIELSKSIFREVRQTQNQTELVQYICSKTTQHNSNSFSLVATFLKTLNGALPCKLTHALRVY